MHVMLDLETMGTAPGCVVRSIGALAFDLNGGRHGHFYRNIDWASCVGAGLTLDLQTVEWWSRQSDAARAALEVNARPLIEVADAFADWFKSVGGSRVWAHGATFDPPVWQAACAAVDRRAPWHYRAVRDTRTVFDLAGFDFSAVPVPGTYHHALDDAAHQADCLVRAWRMIGNPPAADLGAAFAGIIEKDAAACG